MITKELLKANAIISIHVEQDDDAVIGNACPDDPQVEQEIIDRLNTGDVWAWACVRVVVSYMGLESDAYLGHCTYSDEDDFVNNSVYYDDMVEEVIDDLYGMVKAIQDI